MYFKTFESYSESNHKLYEFLGLGKLFKTLFASVSKPLQHRIETIQKNINSKTGKILNIQELIDTLVKTFQDITDTKVADLKHIDDVKMVKTVLKEFLTEIRVVFSAARIPFSAIILIDDPNIHEPRGSFKDMLKSVIGKDKGDVKRKTSTEEASSETEEANESILSLYDELMFEETYFSDDEDIFEGLKNEFSEIMNIEHPEEFDEQISDFIDEWVEQNDTGNIKELENHAIYFVKSLMKSFKRKISEFGKERLEALIALSSKDKKPTDTEVQTIMGSKTKTLGATLKGGRKVISLRAKKIISEAVKKAIEEEATMYKVPGKIQGTYDIIIKNVTI